MTAAAAGQALVAFTTARDGLVVTTLIVGLLTSILTGLLWLIRADRARAARIRDEATAQAAMADQQADQVELLNRLVREVLPNGGSSLRDAIDRVDRRSQQNAEGIRATNARIDHWLAAGSFGRRATDMHDPQREGEQG